MISDLIARDAPFYDPAVTEEMIAKTAQFAREIGVLSGPVSYERAVATQFRELWKG
jgi:hypothetical protein